jgi:hypothetical protein
VVILQDSTGSAYNTPPFGQFDQWVFGFAPGTVERWIAGLQHLGKGFERRVGCEEQVPMFEDHGAQQLESVG